MAKKILTRREFLKTSASAAVAGAVYLNRPAALFADEGKAAGKTPVVLIRHQKAVMDINQYDKDLLAGMLDEAVTALTGANDAEAAWKTIAGPEDVVGVKTNVWNRLPTPPALEDAIERRLQAAGVPEGSISVDDRGIRSNPVFQNSTALVDIRPVRTHNWSGVGTLIKNYIMFVDEPSAYHPDSCADLAKIWKLPAVAGKTRLNVLVALTPQFHSVGPHSFNPKYTWAYGGLLVGFDPVAVDATGVRIIVEKRKQFFGDDRPINPPPKHVHLADTRHHLGTADPEKIDLIRIGWKEDSLI